MTTRPHPLPRSQRPAPGRTGAIAKAMLVTSMALALVLAGCRKPQPPDPEVPPEPQAGTSATTSPSTATAARDVADTERAYTGASDAFESRAAERDGSDGYRTPLERVRDVETKVGDAAERTRATIDPP